MLPEGFQLSQVIDEPDALMTRIVAETPWKRPIVGDDYVLPRQIAWYADPGLTYYYSGIANDPLPWTEALQDLKALCQRVAGADLNSALLNYYQNGNDTVGWHSDAEPELGPEPTIASVSLGVERTFEIKPRRGKKAIIPIRLPNGSVLVMSGRSQADWLHRVPVDEQIHGARLNITFRYRREV